MSPRKPDLAAEPDPLLRVVLARPGVPLRVLAAEARVPWATLHHHLRRREAQRIPCPHCGALMWFIPPPVSPEERKWKRLLADVDAMAANPEVAIWGVNQLGEKE